MKIRSVAVSILAIALFAWFLSSANLGEVWTHVQRARLDYLVIAFVLMSVTYWVRAIRWQHMLTPIGPTRFRTVFRSTIIGFAALGILPARAGDLLRPYLVARQEQLPAPATFATIVMERVLDLLAVLLLLAGFVWSASAAALVQDSLLQPIKIAASLALLATVALLGLMWTLATHPERIGGLVFTAARVLPRGMARSLGRVASTFSSGFAMARQPRELAIAVLWSFPLWIIYAAEAWFVTRAFGIEMPFAGSFLLQGLLVIGVAVPTPGGVGSFHQAYRIGVTAFFGASDEAAVAAGIVLHAISFLPVVLVGIVFMAQDGLSLGSLKALASTAREKEMPDSNEMPVLRPSGR
ncbi:MAG: flippase-like domain-containing protein [Acidobacteria bacterium]|nr:flippase-like domain-containing protein [Acidobacteriota bacterium]